MWFADSNYHRAHNGFQYIHYEYNCQYIESCCAERQFPEKFAQDTNNEEKDA
jgi:hypothetical protein